MLTGPAADGDALYLDYKLGQPAFVALDRETGATRWAIDWMPFEPTASELVAVRIGDRPD
jgi:hypothetical protein